MPTEKDLIIIKLQEGIAKEKEEIAKIDSPKWFTNLLFRETPASASVNLHTVSDEEVIIAIMATLIGKKRDYSEARKSLSLPEKDYIHFGYTFAEWTADLNSRLAKINIAARKKALALNETRLLALESVELKEKKELDSIMKELGY